MIINIRLLSGANDHRAAIGEQRCAFEAEVDALHNEYA
jgi:hypothetical protein